MGMALMNFGEKFQLTCGTIFRVSKGDKQRRLSSINRGKRLGQGARDSAEIEGFRFGTVTCCRWSPGLRLGMTCRVHPSEKKTKERGGGCWAAAGSGDGPPWAAAARTRADG
jgi:hypothetical protein